MKKTHRYPQFGIGVSVEKLLNFGGKKGVTPFDISL
jgi:hypothetical protein